MLIFFYLVRHKVNCNTGYQTKDLVVLDLAGSSPVECNTSLDITTISRLFHFHRKFFCTPDFFKKI